MSNQLRYRTKNFSVGDTIQVHQRVLEGDKERTQVFEGILISVRGRGTGKSMVVRKIASGAIGVERIWPISSPFIVNIKCSKRGSVRRAKLYYLRSRTGKEATKIKELDNRKTTSVPSVIKKPIRKANKPTKIVHAHQTPRATSRKTSQKTASK